MNMIYLVLFKHFILEIMFKNFYNKVGFHLYINSLFRKYIILNYYFKRLRICFVIFVWINYLYSFIKISKHYYPYKNNLCQLSQKFHHRSRKIISTLLNPNLLITHYYQRLCLIIFRLLINQDLLNKFKFLCNK